MSFKSRVVSGFGWVAGANFLGQLVTWIITIAVMRLLNPSDYGLMSMATLFVAFLSMMATAGLGPAIVQAISIDDGKLRQLFGLITTLNVVLCVALFSAAPLIAGFFDEQRLTDIVRVLSLQFVIVGLAVIPESMLARELKFKARALVDLISHIAGGLTTLALAYSDFGVWSLVAGATVSVTGKSLGLNLVAPYFCWPTISLKGMAPLLIFGGNVTATRILWFFYSQADVFITGKLLGKEALGFYSVAMHLASLPVQKLSGILNQVAFPAFAQIQGDPSSVARHLLKSIRLLSFFAFPVLWGISSVAPELVAVVLGSKWELAILPLQILPAIMPLRMINTFLPTVVGAIGKPEISLKNLIVASIVMPAAFLVGVQWGIPGLCIAWVVAFPLVFLANLVSALPAVGLRLDSFLAAILRPALSSGVMYCSVMLMGQFVSDDTNGIARLLALVSVGAITYAVASALTNRDGCTEVLSILHR